VEALKSKGTPDNTHTLKEEGKVSDSREASKGRVSRVASMGLDSKVVKESSIRGKRTLAKVSDSREARAASMGLDSRVARAANMALDSRVVKGRSTRGK